MSNQQWNQGQGSEWSPQQPQGTPEQGQQQEWGQPRQDWGQQDWAQQGQTSATDWGQPAPQPSAPQGNDWTQAQPSAQPPAQEWGQPQAQPSAHDWGQPQPQRSAQDWGQQGWDQNQQWGKQPQQQWGAQGQAPVGAPLPGAAPQWAPQPKKPSPFEFSFKQPALPDAAGTIFLVGTIGIGVWWLFQLFESLTYILDYPVGFFGTVLGGAGLAIFGIMVLRAVLEVGVAVWRRPDPEAGKVEAGEAEDSEGPASLQ